ncbi:hypothetical protein BDF14DRAFT_1943123 [Spinellus fusiger]|nr:hypothetical protein BDF14DRAFT_1943123 [Spinellus fusiger]
MPAKAKTSSTIDESHTILGAILSVGVVKIGVRATQIREKTKVIRAHEKKIENTQTNSKRRVIILSF